MYNHPDEYAQDLACRDAIRAACPDAHVDLIHGVIIVSAPDSRAHVFTFGGCWHVRAVQEGVATPHATQSSAVARVRAILDAQARPTPSA